MDRSPPNRGLIGWFSSNHVAANLLMLFIISAGLFAITTTKKESFPTFQFDQVDIRLFYPGAGPEEVEEGIVVKIEEVVFWFDTNTGGVFSASAVCHTHGPSGFNLGSNSALVAIAISPPISRRITFTASTLAGALLVTLM